MKHNLSRSASFLLIAIVFLGVLAFGIQQWRLRAPVAADVSSAEEAVGIDAGHGLRAAPPSAPRILRHNPSKDPANGGEAARLYYAKREEMLLPFWGPPMFDGIMNGLATSSDKSFLLGCIGYVSSFEFVRALPLVRELLKSPHHSVQMEAAEALCQFGDKAGFDFLVEKVKTDDGDGSWSNFLSIIFAKHPRQDYNEELINIMRKSNLAVGDRRVTAYALAKVLGRLGDNAALEILLPTMLKKRCESDDMILAIRSLQDVRIPPIMQDIFANGSSANSVNAAAIVLASHGDSEVQRYLAEVVDGLAGLPEGKPTVIGPAHPSRDDDAFIVMRDGMDSVHPSLAVPVLKNITLNASFNTYVTQAVIQLAKIGDAPAREALLEAAQSITQPERGFNGSMNSTLGGALLLFNDEETLQVARKLFGGSVREFETLLFIAEAKGWKGVFGQYNRF